LGNRGSRVFGLRRDHVEPGMNIHSELDRRTLAFNLQTGSRNGGYPFAMHGCCFHRYGELTHSPTRTRFVHVSRSCQPASMMKYFPNAQMEWPNRAPENGSCVTIAPPRRPTTQLPRRPPQSLSSGSFGDSR
jgi:hypothetical protein